MSKKTKTSSDANTNATNNSNLDLQSLITQYLQSEQAFPVNFQEFWQWCGYARKDNAKRVLEKNFAQSIDYQVFRKNAENPKGGRPTEVICLTTDCAKSLAMLAQTSQGREVRLYFIECEKHLKALTQKPTSIFDVLEASIGQLREQDARIRALEEKQAQAEATLKAMGQAPVRTMLISVRKGLDELVKTYATAHNVAPQHLYALLYQRFAVQYHINLPLKARRAGISQIQWVEENGWITQLYDLAKQLFLSGANTP